MCGRYTLAMSHPELEARFDFRTSDFSWVPRYNIAPTQSVVAVLNNGERHAGLLRWGLVPYGAKDLRVGNRMINARAETITRPGVFLKSFKQRRCLIIADGFYEWKKEGRNRLPLYIRLASEDAFAFAGLWAAWESPEGEWVRSCTIITTSPNSFMGPIHDRMPVILTRGAEDIWMDRDLEDAAELRELLVPYPSAEMTAYPVSTVVNSPKNDVPECIAPVSISGGEPMGTGGPTL